MGRTPRDCGGSVLAESSGNRPYSLSVRPMLRARWRMATLCSLLPVKYISAARTEQEVFAKLGLPWIPPELREGQGDVASHVAPRQIAEL
ncbi:MAG: hypothetical protein ACK462_06465, partial [Planctomyces sp.]